MKTQVTSLTKHYFTVDISEPAMHVANCVHMDALQSVSIASEKVWRRENSAGESSTIRHTKIIHNSSYTLYLFE